MKVKYMGPFDEVLVAEWLDDNSGLSQVVKRNHSVDIPDELAERLLEQEDNWHRYESPTTAKAKTEPTNPED